jgi:NADPH:quinone reductase-like Zn-dependent oxidoreductase
MTHSTKLVLNAFGPLDRTDGLALTEAELPAPGPREVLVDLHAASLNFRDLMTVTGVYNPRMSLPRIPGSDAAGTVLAVGPQVTRFAPGDRVTTLFFQDWQDGEIQPATGKSALGGSIDGAFTTARLFPETGLIRMPDYLTHEQAATLPCAALTAWNALVEKGNVRAGETVLVLGTGGVSLFALQIAKAHGARVILTSSSDEKLVRARSLGADETINYRATPDWDEAVLKLTASRGVDHVVEVGGAGTLPRSLRSARPSGHVYIIGVLSGPPKDPGEGIDVRTVLTRSLNVCGTYVGSEAMFHRMNAAFAANRIQPVIDRIFPLASYREAFTHMQTGSHFGKIVLSLKN